MHCQDIANLLLGFLWATRYKHYRLIGTYLSYYFCYEKILQKNI